MFQINALATFAAVFMPAFFPKCHMLHEVRSILIPAPGLPNFMEVSPDRIIKCIGNCATCNNLMDIPCGTMALELKCPYTPIHDKKLLPVQYQPPQYHCCQLPIAQPNDCDKHICYDFWILFSRIHGNILCG